MDNHSTVIGWEEFIFPYKHFNISVAIELLFLRYEAKNLLVKQYALLGPAKMSYQSES